MNSKEILIENIRNNYDIHSIRDLAKKVNLSPSILLNWSSGRSSPSLIQLDHIAFILNISTPLLIKRNINITIETPIWKEGVRQVFIENISRLKREYGFEETEGLSYRNLLLYASGSRKNINTVILDRIASVYKMETYKLLESERMK
ncbi:helix-turn-helix domain-containing protein [Clostridium sporogenes]|uniref:helix-turn-helix domain-containing protein n=1 Tax=Clostridium sporogenes TaxID=1509 RepID=UPI0022371211|nr:hypothetical protein [Clostridium sporogenes]EJP6471873.1 hypothetical protein [Clostridium botulinum]EJP6474259.1 hypothetical protein [Clostridium botulinum]MCW6107995.1 hypothetical protein [Clostridium sporogenes]